MKVPVLYSGKKFKLEQYTTKQEKDILLLPNFENFNLDSALEICGMNEDEIEKLSREEKIFLLLKYRCISVGDDVNFKFTCSECSSPNDNVLTIGEMVQSSNIKNKYIIDQYKELTEDNFQDFLSIDIDDMDLDEYNKIYDEINESITKFNFIFPIVCQKCGTNNYINLGSSDKDVINLMSETNLQGLYKTYNDIIMNSNYSKLDIDSMLPFERTILIGLLNKTREEQQK